MDLLTAVAIKEQALELGFDLCGIAPADNHPELNFFRDWLARGYAGEMGYLARSADQRADVRAVLPSARTVIVTATVYNTDRPYSTQCADAGRAQIARYAWGDDYHDVIGRAPATRSSPGCAQCRRSRSRRARTWIPDRFRNASTRNMPASAGLARTPA